MAHKWTSGDRVLLCILKRLYPRKHIAQLFNHLRTTRVNLRGLRDSIRIETLETQWHGMKNGSKGHEILHQIERCNDQQLKRSFRTVLEEIRLAAVTLRIRKQVDKKRVRRSPSIVDTIVSEIPIMETEYPEVETGPSLRRFLYDNAKVDRQDQRPLNSLSQDFRDNLSSRPVAPTFRVTRNSDNQVVQAHPLLLFRATSTIDSFRTRKFQNPADLIKPPPAFNTSDWHDIAIPHLQRCKRYPSPFLSLAQKCKNALNRVELFSSEEIDKKFFLAIFEFDAVRTDAESRFGPGTGPCLVRAMFPAGQLSSLPNGYKGCGEWLVYGSIECAPIAVLDANHAVKLGKALRRLAQGNVEAIRDITTCLAVIPQKWREAVGYQFLRAYCGKTEFSKVGSPQYERIMREIYRVGDESNDVFSRSVQLDSEWISISTSFPSDYEQHDEGEEEEVEEDEHEEHEEEAEDRDDGQANSTSTTSRPIVRVLKSQQQYFHGVPLQQSNPVARLNSLTGTLRAGYPTENARPDDAQESTAFNNSPQPRHWSALPRFDRGRGGDTPFWSPDNDSEVEEMETENADEYPISASEPIQHIQAEPGNSSPSAQSSLNYQIPRGDELPVNGDETDDEWDFVEDDLEQSFTNDFPFAAAKARRFDNLHPRTNFRTASNSVIQSAEKDDNNNLDRFTQELLATAFAPTPTPVHIETPRLPRHVPLPFILTGAKDVAAGTNPPAQRSTRPAQIDLTSEISKLPETPTRRPNKRTTRIREQKDFNDEDFVIIGSSRRREGLPLRSLSVQEENIICLD